MKNKPIYGALIVIPIQGMITPDHILPVGDVFVATSRGNDVVTQRATNVVAKDYV